MKRHGQMRIHACPRCGGAAYLDNSDDEEWRCLQCGRNVPLPASTEKKAVVSVS